MGKALGELGKYGQSGERSIKYLRGERSLREYVVIGLI